ncbi:MAG: TetR/AcrR family transcriptional regulator [Ilumatobacteraceae bacterium]
MTQPRKSTRSTRPAASADASLPAHRPSRREDIIDAAIRLFARKGFVDASIGDVADEAEVVVTAVYYHFSGKEELFSAAVHKVFDMISGAVTNVRADASPSDQQTLDAVIDAVWQWIDTHPDEATLVHLQLPGATRQITTLRQEFEELHVQRAFGYLGPAEARGRPSATRRAVETLSVRTLVDLLIAVHTMRLADGPLSGEASDRLRLAVRDLSRRIVTIEP